MHWMVHAAFWPLLWMGVWLIPAVLRHRRRMAELRLQAARSAPSPDENAELEQLRQRVRVLERIATDYHRSDSLADEIEALRGQ